MKLTRKQLKLSEVQFKLFKEAKMYLNYAYGALEHLHEEDMQTQLLREMEMHLHYAHEAMRTMMKDLHCDDGQEYPVPYVSTEKPKRVVPTQKNNPILRFVDKQQLKWK